MPATGSRTRSSTGWRFARPAPPPDMRLANVVGTRPQLIKAAALQSALRELHDEVFIDTGQHWDETMAGGFFRELGLRPPDVTLGIGGGAGAEQTGRMLVALEGTLR